MIGDKRVLQSVRDLIDWVTFHCPPNLFSLCIKTSGNVLRMFDGKQEKGIKEQAWEPGSLVQLLAVILETEAGF